MTGFRLRVVTSIPVCPIEETTKRGCLFKKMTVLSGSQPNVRVAKHTQRLP